MMVEVIEYNWAKNTYIPPTNILMEMANEEEDLQKAWDDVISARMKYVNAVERYNYIKRKKEDEARGNQIHIDLTDETDDN